MRREVKRSKEVKMRREAIRLMELIHGFFIFSVLYCAVYTQFAENMFSVFQRSLILFLMILVCSLSVDKGIKFSVYMLISGAMCVGTYALCKVMTGSVFQSGLLVLLELVISVNYFFAKANNRKCWIENPVYPALLYYIVICFYAGYLKNDFLVKYVCLAAGCHFLMVNIQSNYVHMELFMQDYEKLERLPVNRMNHNNRRMMWIQSGIVSIAMIVAPYLKLDQLIVKLGIALKNILIWIITHIGQNKVEEEVEQLIPQQSADFGMEGFAGEENLFFKILDIIMRIVGWILILGLLFLLFRFLYRKFLELYSQFNTKTEDNGDVVENLIADAQTLDKAYQVQKKKPTLFWDLSPDARIRKHYKKRVLKDYKETIPGSWTPEQIEEKVLLGEKEKERFHLLYEKARYAKESCNREEVQEMTRL